MIMRVRLYVDGFNFYYGAKRIAAAHKRRTGSPLMWKWLDIPAMCEAIICRRWPGSKIAKSYYFTATVKERWVGDKAHDRQHAYHRALGGLGMEVEKGKFIFDQDHRPLALQKGDSWLEFPYEDRRAFVTLPQEKRSDVNLASALLIDYFTENEEFDRSVIVCNDTDQVTPVEYLRERGWPLGVISPDTSASKKLQPEVLSDDDFGACVTADDMTEHQLPTVVPTPTGRQVRRPPGW